MTKLKVSTYIITYNEEKNIGSLLKGLVEFDEVIVVDSGSTDRTVKIAEEFPNTKVFYKKFLGFSEQKAYALSLCSNAWVLNMDADELVTEKFLQAIRETMDCDEYSALESTRTLLRWGKKPRHFSKPERLVRFFRKDSGHYESRRVHESISVVGKIAKTDAAILHCENLTLTRRVEKSNSYSALRARDKFEAGHAPSKLGVFLAFPLTFLRLYFIKGHCFDGVDGYLTCMNAAFYAFMKYSKVWELHSGRTDLNVREASQSTGKHSERPDHRA